MQREVIQTDQCVAELKHRIQPLRADLIEDHTWDRPLPLHRERTVKRLVQPHPTVGLNVHQNTAARHLALVKQDAARQQRQRPVGAHDPTRVDHLATTQIRERRIVQLEPE